MQDSERVAEVLGAIRQRDLISRGEMEIRVGRRGQAAAANLEGFARGIDAVKTADPRRNKRGPAARSAAEIEPFGVGRKVVPRKFGEILIEQPMLLVRREAMLVERCPFAAKVGSGGRVDV